MTRFEWLRFVLEHGWQVTSRVERPSSSSGLPQLYYPTVFAVFDLCNCVTEHGSARVMVNRSVPGQVAENALGKPEGEHVTDSGEACTLE